MAGILPKDPRVGDPITARIFKDVVQQHRKSQMVGGTGMNFSQGAGGTVVSARRQIRQRVSSVDNSLFPFAIIVATPEDPNTPSPADWRTFTVHAATVKNSDIDNDDSSDSPIVIQVPAGTNNMLVWLKATLDTKGNVTAATMEFGSTLPDQPDGDDDTGEPPDTFILKIAKISVGSDDKTASDYQKVDIDQFVKNSQWITIITVGIKCTGGNGIIALKGLLPGPV